ncbi:MAG: phenylalanine--tRNA ligase subunit beta [Bacteroidota bacterium]
MNVSTNWLSDYVAHGLSADALGDALTMSGLELEEITRTGPSWVEAEPGVLVGHVLDVRPHPNADRLRLCDVDLGRQLAGADLRFGEPVQIVCGAPNVEAGQKVPVATVGTVLDLPARDGSGLQPVTIKKGKIRGEVSMGMICAEDELGIGTDHDGILVLDPAATIGQPFAEYLAQRGELPGDAVLDLAITPNRPDATSHIGVARDVAALTGQPLRQPEIEIPKIGGAVNELATVTIEAPEACPRFVGMVIESVTVGPSPEWLQEKLRAIGLRPISNVVDITNFVMMETGQPLHAYDLDQLAQHQLIVRQLDAEETFTTLDGTERTLPEGTTVIADGEGTVGIAGIMGGLDSEVTDATTRVFMEGATWDPATIRQTAKALGMQTDASYRFERGADPTRPPYAVARASHLTVELAGGTLVGGRIDEHPIPYKARTVELRPSRVAHVLGMEVPRADIVRLLTAIGFEVRPSEDHTLDAFAESLMQKESLTAAADDAASASLTVVIPPFRPDVEREIDVIEEVARLWGYDRLPAPASTPVPLIPAGDTPGARQLADVRRQLAALGGREIATNSLVPKETAEHFADADWTGLAAPPVETLNPISQEMAALRPSLLTGLLTAMSYNQARGAGQLTLFEAGHVYRRAEDPSSDVEGYHEHTSLVIGLSGSTPATWNAPSREMDVYDLKGVVTAVLDGLGLRTVTETPHPEPSALTAYALDLSVGDTSIGRLGRISNALADTYDLQAPAFVAELHWGRIAALVTQDDVRYTPISRFPTVERDLALVIPDRQPAGPILNAIRKAGRPLLQEVRPFDVYRGEHVAEGSKSLAVSLRFGADRTLRDKEVDGRVQRIVKVLESEFGATLRS